MKNKLMKIGVPGFLMMAAMFFYFSATEKAKTLPAPEEVYSVNNFDSKAKPYVGVKLPASNEVHVEVASFEESKMPEDNRAGGKIYFAPGSFDHKRIDKQAVKNQRAIAKSMERRELMIIEREIASDEIKIQELIQKGDSENVAYLENLMAQKKIRHDELKYQ